MSRLSTIVFADTFLFDVGMEGVVHDSTIGMIYLASQTSRIVMVGQEVVLKPVQAFDRQSHVFCCRVFRCGSHDFDAPLPFVACWAGAGEFSQSRMKRSRQNR